MTHLTHPIQEGTSQDNLLFLSVIMFGPEPSSERRLVTEYRSLCVALHVVAGFSSPRGTSHFKDPLGMTISLR